MLKFKKRHGKVLSLVLAMVMLFCSMFAMTASAHNDEEETTGEFRIISTRVLREGYANADSRQELFRSCTHPHTVLYMYEHNEHSVNEYCIVVVREYCPDCGWYNDVECIGVGGHHPYLYLPNWPY